MRIFIAFILLFALHSCRWVETKEEKRSKELQNMMAPDIRTKVFIHTDDFDSREDLYQWMVANPKSVLDTNNSTNKEIYDHIKAENEYASAKFYDFNSERKKLEEELTELAKLNDKSIPFVKGEYSYFYQYNEDSNYPALYRFKDSEEQKELILDFQKLSKNLDYFRIGDIKISHNNKFIAYAVDTEGKNQFKVKILDIDKKMTQNTSINNSDGKLVWGINDKSVFYSLQIKDQSKKYPSVYQYHFFETGKKNKLILEDKTPGTEFELSKSKSGRYLFVKKALGLFSQTYFLDLLGKTEIKEFQERERGTVYDLEHQGNHFIIRTNFGGASNFALFKCKITEYSDKSKWQNLIAHREDIVLGKMEVFDNFIVLEENMDGLKKFHILNSETGLGHYADFPEETYSARLNYNFDHLAPAFIYEYSSLSTPPTIFSYDIETRRTSVIARSGLDEIVNSDSYRTERIWATSFDGTKIPISIIYSRNTARNGKAPLIITCEGAYGKTNEMKFNYDLLNLLDNGFIYAIAHTRGGGYLGETWHKQGIQKKKINTIMDFVSSVKHITNMDYAAPDKVFAYGADANSTIIAAAMNTHPDLFKAVVLRSPKVDLLTRLLLSGDTDLGEKLEWGDPENEESYFYLKSYSPYDNIHEAKYPSILVLNDLFGGNGNYYWEGLKWVAKLRSKNLSDSRIIIHTELEQISGSVRNRQKRIEKTALIYSYIFSKL